MKFVGKIQILFITLSFPVFAAYAAEVAMFYQDIDYGGNMVALPEGKYPNIATTGMADNAISSLKVCYGFAVEAYSGPEFTGKVRIFTSDTDNVGDEWNDDISSVKIYPKGSTGLTGVYKIQNGSSGLYADVDNNSTENNYKVVQYYNEGNEHSQFWQVEEVSPDSGVYIIRNYRSGKVMDIVDGNTKSGSAVQQYDYNGNFWQQFIIIKEENGYCYLIARHSEK